MLINLTILKFEIYYYPCSIYQPLFPLPFLTSNFAFGE